MRTKTLMYLIIALLVFQLTTSLASLAHTCPCVHGAKPTTAAISYHMPPYPGEGDEPL